MTEDGVNYSVDICKINFSVIIGITFIGYWGIGSIAILRCITNDVDETIPPFSCFVCF